MTHKTIKSICTISVLLFLLLRFCGLNSSSSLSYSVTAAASISILYDLFLWRINPFEQTPRIYGTYDAIFHSNFNGGTTHRSKVKIKQSLSHIYIFEECEDGYSESVIADLVKNVTNGQWHLCYTYSTHPTFSKQTKNDDPHLGTVMLRVKDKSHLVGTYFTNRKDPTGGDFELSRTAN